MLWTRIQRHGGALLCVTPRRPASAQSHARAKSSCASLESARGHFHVFGSGFGIASVRGSRDAI
eukprot:4175719-Lingulodinium_polyedra.AAC.1